MFFLRIRESGVNFHEFPFLWVVVLMYCLLFLLNLFSQCLVPRCILEEMLGELPCSHALFPAR